MFPTVAGFFSQIPKVEIFLFSVVSLRNSSLGNRHQYPYPPDIQIKKKKCEKKHKDVYGVNNKVK